VTTVTDRVLITGAGGQLAAAMAAEYAGHAQVCALGHAELDIASARAVERALSSFRPTHIINCAAYNLVDCAEDEPGLALAVNALAVRILARAAAESGAVLVHFGTDFVFNGLTSRPYTEDDLPNPASVYGASKLLGEWFALEAPRGYVLRVASLFGGSLAKSSVDRIVDALLEGREARVFSDRMVSPSYVLDVAAATRQLTARGAPGLYHCVGTNHCTWHELGLEAARLLNADPKYLVPTPAASVPLRAPRPKYAALSNAKLSAIVPMPTWQDALARYISEALRRRAVPPSRQ
jgi:dTDP-4-dehydrorhamnose reductase